MDPKEASWNTPAGSDERWVCAACGRATPPGTPRTMLREVSCMMHAVLCHAIPITIDGTKRQFLVTSAAMPDGMRFAVPGDACYPEEFL